MNIKSIVLVGNPNTGKSTIFNILTKSHQHTGNWSGKTVGNMSGIMRYRDTVYEVTDIPGIYSTNPLSEDERQAVSKIKEANDDVVVMVIDGTSIERNLMLTLEIIKISPKAVICINLIDEAEKRGIEIDDKRLSELLGVEVVKTNASEGKGIENLKEAIYRAKKGNLITTNCDYIYSECVTSNVDILNNRDRKIDNILTNKAFGIPIMLCLLALILWITIVGANYPSGYLSSVFKEMEGYISRLNLPPILVEGIFRTLGWVVSVMLPPMAIFFPLFAFLEDFGYLPRMAFNLDNIFRKAKAHSKMVLSMCMGLGCNAVGVVSTRIIDSPRERLIAILTNSFIPCNGRFSGLIALTSIFLAGGAFSSIKTALVILLIIMLSVLVTLIVSKILSHTLLKGKESYFILEMPPYRIPNIKNIIKRSVREKILCVLGRAIVVAAPAGAVIWLMENISIDSITLLDYTANFLNPFANIIGMDGYLLTAFILGLPANEIVVPIVIMCYTKNSGLVEFENLSQLGQILSANGWEIKNALCAMLFSVFHFPCATTLLTIKKETHSLKWTVAAFLIPTFVGILICMTVNFLFSF